MREVLEGGEGIARKISWSFAITIFHLSYVVIIVPLGPYRDVSVFLKPLCIFLENMRQ